RAEGHRDVRCPVIQPALARPASWRGRARSLARMFTFPPRVSVPWRRFARHWGRPEDPTPVARAWHLFTREETRWLRELARARGISLGSLLLWSADQALREALIEPDSGYRSLWMYPVNLRGALRGRAE